MIQRVQTGPGPALSYGICPETLHVLCCPFKIKVCFRSDYEEKEKLFGGEGGGGGGGMDIYV